MCHDIRVDITLTPSGFNSLLNYGLWQLIPEGGRIDSKHFNSVIYTKPAHTSRFFIVKLHWGKITESFLLLVSVD